jgi:hypothetical protein
MSVVQLLEASLSTRQKEFAKSMFVESRLQQDIYKAIYRQPSGMLDKINLFDKYKDQLGNIIRMERPDLIDLAIQIELTEDSLERIAIWATQYKPLQQ